MKHHRYAYSRSFGLVAAKCMLVFLLLGAGGSAAAQSLPQHIGYCSYCSTNSAFANKAVQTAPDAAPGNGTPVSYPVYVVNPNSREVRYFNVWVWYDWGDGQPESTDPGDSKESAYSGGSIQSIGLQKEAYPASGNSQLIVAMKDGLFLVQQFANEIIYAQVSTEDLGSDLDSVVQLVGPEGTSASYNRNAIRNLVNNYANDVWTYIRYGASDLIDRFAKRFVGDSGLIQPGGTLTIEAPDGTKIKLRLLYILDSPDDIHLELEVMQETAQGPGLPAVPQNSGEFDGFGYSGDPSTVNAIADLAFMYGIPITGGGGGAIACTRVDGGPLHCELLHF